MMPSYYCKKALGVSSSASSTRATREKGMEKLLNDGDNLLTLVKSTDAITASYVIKGKEQS
jgi:hypothetical protein